MLSGIYPGIIPAFIPANLPDNSALVPSGGRDAIPERASTQGLATAAAPTSVRRGVWVIRQISRRFLQNILYTCSGIRYICALLRVRRHWRRIGSLEGGSS